MWQDSDHLKETLNKGLVFRGCSQPENATRNHKKPDLMEIKNLSGGKTGCISTGMNVSLTLRATFPKVKEKLN